MSDRKAIIINEPKLRQIEILETSERKDFWTIPTGGVPVRILASVIQFQKA